MDIRSGNKPVRRQEHFAGPDGIHRVEYSERRCPMCGGADQFDFVLDGKPVSHPSHQCRGREQFKAWLDSVKPMDFK